MPTCLVVQHVAPESAFALEDALLGAGVLVDTCHVFTDDCVPPDASGLDGLVVMGGPVSAASDQGFPTRGAELALLRDAIATGVPTLGVCLGAQLLAVAAGATVHPGELGPEIGWSPVRLGQACSDDRLFAGLPESLTVLQWHGDTFELPAGSCLLASNSAYPNQAFRIGDAAWGVQFHLEVTAAAVEGFLSAFAADTTDVPGGAEDIAAETPAALAGLGAARDLVFSRFADLVKVRALSRDLVSETPPTV
ncbi:MAG TPA: type 1 glutamine amidotransferase [Acidimicrobiales bacterium]|jgi:GMP synthase-like glutamine amidotransferase|nr:type 1 glutamine amidotransferase [Acidimicrobiales bacterium]